MDSDGTSNEAEISGETAATYTLTAADAGKKIKVQVSFTDELSGEEDAHQRGVSLVRHGHHRHQHHGARADSASR